MQMVYDVKMWDKIWSQSNLSEWDALSQDIFDTISIVSGDLTGKRILEAGCGSGRVSCALALRGAKVTLLDGSEAALDLARQYCRNHGADIDSISFVQGRIENMPFDDQEFDLVWSAGVLEHYSSDYQIELLREMMRVCKDGGKLVVIVPNAACLPYRLGKWVAEVLGKWEFGNEEPLITLSGIIDKLPGLLIEQEYTTGLKDSSFYLSRLPGGTSLAKYLWVFNEFSLNASERTVFPGGLLVSVLRVDRSLTKSPSKEGPKSMERALTELHPEHSTCDIVCLSSIDWDFLWQRPQQMMTRLAKLGCRVIFVNASARSLRVPPEDWEQAVRYLREYILDTLIQSTREVFPNVYSVIPLRSISTPDGKYVIDTTQECIDLIPRVFNLTHPVYWVLTPTWLAGLEGLDQHSILVYDCVDEHSGFPGAPRNLPQIEAALIGISTFMFVTADSLYYSKSQLKDEIYLLPNGVDVHEFEAERPRPVEFRNIPRPILGYSGAVHACVDIDLLCYVAKLHPEWSIVIIGQVFRDVSTLSSFSNVHFLGVKQYSDLPSYLQHFDVGLIPFMKNELTMGTNPIKLYEYLAAGIPVVSTSWPEIEKFRGIISIADSPDEFCRNIEESLGRVSGEFKRQRRMIASKYDWNLFAQEALAIIKGHQARLSAKFDEAYSFFEQAYGLDRINPRIIVDMAEVLCLKGQHDKARDLLRNELKLDKEEPVANIFSKISAKMFTEGFVEPAQETLRYMLKINPRNETVLGTMGIIALYLGDRERALRYLQSACDLDPENEVLREWMSRALHNE